MVWRGAKVVGRGAGVVWRGAKVVIRGAGVVGKGLWDSGSNG